MVNKKAVIYARFSSHSQKEESIEAQVRICSEYAKKKGYVVANVYADRGFSAKTDDRPAFQEMIGDSARKMFSVVICHKLDRFSRNNLELYLNKKRLNKNKVTLEYADQPIDGSPEGQLMESMLAGMAQFYIANLGRETRKGLDQCAIKGKPTGGKLPFGYYRDGNGTICVNEKEANVVRKMFADKEFLSYAALAEKYDKPVSTVKTILRNQKYVGQGLFGVRTRIGSDPIPMSFPAIIGKEVS